MHGQRNIKIVRSGVSNIFSAGGRGRGWEGLIQKTEKKRSLGISWPDMRKYVTISREKWRHRGLNHCITITLRWRDTSQDKTVRKPDDTTGTVENFSKKNRNIGKVRTEICVVEENEKAVSLFRFCNKLRYKVTIY